MNTLRIIIIIFIILPSLILSSFTASQTVLTDSNKILVKNALATKLSEFNNYTLMEPLRFSANEILDENVSDAIYPAFNYGLTEINQSHNKDLKIDSSFLPMPDLRPELRTSPETPTAEEASQTTQMAIERMVNPSSLLSSAINDIRESGGSSANPHSNASPGFNLKRTTFDAEFSTIHLYGKAIPPKDYLIISSNEEKDKSRIYASARIPCNGAHETPLRIILLENWSSIVYPLPEMHLIKEIPDGELCMFRIEYPELGIEDSHIQSKSSEEGSIDDLTENPIFSKDITATVLYNSGVSDIKFPKASSVTLSHIGSP